ncbi:MAG: WbuC family cupin fold metalloprotein, partial [Nanoarchaeota archaeon]
MLHITSLTLEELVQKSRHSERKRALSLLRSSDKGEIPAVMFNCLQPGTYVQPHMHPNEDGKEIWIPQGGVIRAVLFDENGEVGKHFDIGLYKTAFLEILSRTYHTAIALEPDSIMCELYMGVYSP